MQYQGFAFDRQFDKGRKSGSITVDFERIRFVRDEVELSLPLMQLKAEFGGAGHRLIYFSHPDVPATTICTPDKGILKDEALINSLCCMELVHTLKHKQMVRRLVTLISLAVIGFIILFPFVFADSLIHVAANKVPIEWEQKLGERLFDSLTSDKRIIDSPALKGRLYQIAGPLLAEVKRECPDHEFDLYIIEDPMVNAFALPGGKVVVNSGLILKSETPEEIAGVLAHELAHVTCRHHIRGTLKRIGIFAVLGFLAGDMSSVSDLLLSYGGSLAMLKNSRTFEFEADKQGWVYLNQARIDPQGMIDFFKKLESDSGKMNPLESQLDFLSTHPATRERIERLEEEKKALTKAGDYHKLDIDFETFQAELEKALK